jgi:hypothetical protein
MVVIQDDSDIEGMQLPEKGRYNHVRDSTGSHGELFKWK